MANLWRLVRSDAGDAGWNMAVDEAIMEAVLAGEQPPTVRFYRWRSPSVSLGRFQKAEKVLDLALCRERGVQVVGRLTGGKAVLHGHDLTLSVVAPLHCFLPAHRVVEVHLRIVHALAQGFRLLGIETRPVSRTDLRHLRASSANCFDHALPGDLTTPDGVKLAGGAQYRRGDVVLEQMSIPFQPLPEALRGCLQGWKEPAPSPLIGVAEDTLIEAICAGIAQQFDLTWNSRTLSADEIALASRLVEGYVETAGKTSHELSQIG